MTIINSPKTRGGNAAPFLRAACIFVLSLSSAVFADTPAGTVEGVEGVALVGHSSSAASDASLGGIVVFAARLRLEHNGLESVVVPDTGSAERDPGAVLAGPDSKGAKYLLLLDYSDEGESLSLHFGWFDGASKTWMAELDRSGPKNMQVDELIFKSIDDLLDQVAAKTPGIAKARIAAEQAPAGPAPAAAVAEPVQNGPETIPSTQAPSLPGVQLGSTPQRSPGGLELAFDAGPFLAGGALGNYFQAAGEGEGRATWNFPGKAFSYGLGIKAACLLFQAQGPLESAKGILAPLAIDLRLTALADEGRLKPFVHGSAGMALMNLQTPIYGSQSAFLPFAELGLGLGWVLGSGLGLSMDLSYSAFVDGEDLIMGFNPTIGIEIPVGKRP